MDQYLFNPNHRKKFHCFNDQSQQEPFGSKVKLQWDCITLFVSHSLAQADSLSLTQLIGMICPNGNTLLQSLYLQLNSKIQHGLVKMNIYMAVWD